MFDTNGDGNITIREFENSLKRLTSSNDLALDEGAGVDTIIQQMTQNNKQDISLEEFESFYLNCFKEEDVNLRDAFNMFDTNKDGSIQFKEFRNMMTKIDGAASQEELKALFNEADTNGDGVIDYKEFLVIMSDQAGEPLPDSLGS